MYTLLVDWDTTLLAAPERDLWSMAFADATAVDTYEEMTGRQLDRQGLDCYRLGWDLAEICGYIAVLRHRHEDSADMRASWSNLQHCLDPAARWPQLVEPATAPRDALYRVPRAHCADPLNAGAGGSP